jgi:hypothetical protein
MRSTADKTDDLKAKAAMTGAAEAYEKLAREVELRSVSVAVGRPESDHPALITARDFARRAATM